MSASAAHPLLAAVLTSTLQEATGRLLARAPNGGELLSRMAGRVIALEIRPFRQTLYLCPADHDIQVFTEISGEPDVTIKGAPSAFARMGMGGALEKTLTAGEIEISGDSSTARRFQELLKNLEVDWTRVLTLLTRSPLTGAALAGLLRVSRKWSHDTVISLQDDVSEYLREEARLLPVQYETDRFNAGVDALRAHRDRLQARIARLNSKRIPPPSNPSL